MKALFAFAALLALGACASDPGTVTADAKSPAYVRCTVEPTTGTRVKRCPNELMLREIGSDQAQEDATRVRSLSNVTGAVGH